MAGSASTCRQTTGCGLMGLAPPSHNAGRLVATRPVADLLRSKLSAPRTIASASSRLFVLLRARETSSAWRARRDLVFFMLATGVQNRGTEW